MSYVQVFTLSLLFLTTSRHVQGRNENVIAIYRDYLEHMIGYVNESVPACENFFLHSCRKTSGNESASDSQEIPPFLYNHQDYYDFFELKKEEFDTRPGILVRNLYDLCKMTKNGPRRMWQRLIHEIPFLKPNMELLRKWPFLQYQWHTYEMEKDLNWATLAAEFSAHGLEIFYNIFFAESAIYITPNTDFLCPDLEDFKRTLKPVLGQRSDQTADIVGAEMLQLCRQLKGEIPLSQEVEEVYDFLLDDTMGEFLQRFFLRLKVTDLDIMQARKFVVDVERLSEIMTVLKSANPRVVYNYVVWHILQQLRSFEDCFTLTDEFSHMLQVEYWHWNVLVKHFRREVAIALYIFHTTRFQRTYRQAIASSSFERMFQNRSERKELNVEKSIRNFASEYLEFDNYSVIFQSELLDSANRTFYSSLFEMRKLSLRYSFFNSYMDKEDLNFFNEFISFCISLQYRPLFHYFASHDREMWRDSKILHSTDGLYTALDCLERQSRLNADDYGEMYRMLDMDEVKELYDFYISFKESVADYVFWLESEIFSPAEDFLLEHFKFDAAQIMFYAVAQQYCNRNDPAYSNLINRAFMNVPGFQEAFECSNIDPMAPASRCVMK